jgi:hypothetical protein
VNRIDLPSFFQSPNTRISPPHDVSFRSCHTQVVSIIEMKIEMLRVGHFRKA